MPYVLTLIFTLVLPTLSWAEYRAYDLKIIGPVGERKVRATLDHRQYPDYYPLGATERIEYLDSWMCYGRQDRFEPPCPNPRQPASSSP